VVSRGALRSSAVRAADRRAARTGDEGWFERARRFALHALGQVERLRANGRGRYSLWRGDLGTALFAAACLDIDTRYPILDIV
jgi:hypothetical protein